MAEERLNLEPEVQAIFDHIDRGENFLLSGGAGSGKTYSLVQVIRQAITEYPLANVACITYTNAAVREIGERVNHGSLTVRTIHEFLWDSMKSFQQSLKTELLGLIADGTITVPAVNEGATPPDYTGKEISYKEYTLLREGIISHDELLLLAHRMFGNQPKLCDILKDRFRFIFVDEYQDTSPLVVDILLSYLARSSRSAVVGFFGDATQSIYDGSVGNLDSFIASGLVHEVRKEQNRRNPRLVYELANRLRTDGIVQRHSDDPDAPNMIGGVVKEGEIKFYFSSGPDRLSEARSILGWDFSDSEETKELNLTHNLIAAKAGFKELMDIYEGDKILDYKDRIRDYIKKNAIPDDFSALTFGDVVDSLLTGATTNAAKRMVNPTAGMQEFIDANPELYAAARSSPYEIFRKIHISKDDLIDDKKDESADTSKPGSKRDDLVKHLLGIQHNLHLYQTGKHNEFLRVTEFRVSSAQDKRHLKAVTEELAGMDDASTGDVIEFAHSNGIRRKDDRLARFLESKRYVFDRVAALDYGVVKNLYAYLEGLTAFSTQHKIKGAQFDNVLVILENGGWSKYNFQYLFENNGTESVKERTRKLFYVCCTRSKERLAIYYHNPTPTVLDTARAWFGTENVLGL
jgi:DNA helicase-2/ATP-dependent DNA helicase PcrA